MMGPNIFRTTAIFIVAFALGLTFAFLISVNRGASTEATELSFEVSEGEGPRSIANRLQKEGLLSAERPFLVYVLLTGKRNKFYVGNYTLRRDMTIREMVRTLSDPSRQEIVITVLEGWRITDIAKELADKTDITESAFLTLADPVVYEGYLFPDTYHFEKKVTAEQALAKLRTNFDRRTAGLQLTRDDVILASIVEREAKLAEDKPKVAGVYLNRLKIDMALQADPTVQYAKGSWAPITVADYQNVISPHNTYLNKGLPPTPISNPGLAALKAVKEPATHDFYYFIHVNDGTTYYARNGEEHNANKRRYLQ